jgi:hypothetical protein
MILSLPCKYEYLFVPLHLRFRFVSFFRVFVSPYMNRTGTSVQAPRVIIAPRYKNIV